MALTLSDIHALREKFTDPIVVGELPDSIRVELGLRVPLVHLSAVSLKHINEKHPDVSDFDLLILPFAIQSGLILRETQKKHVLLACYQEPGSHRRFIAIMKVTARECEVWLDSFHRMKTRQTKRLLRRAEILKSHD